MNDISQIVSHNIKRLRKERQLTLQELSAKSGVSVSMLGSIERGDTTPTITTLDKIANGFKVKLSKIIEEEQERVLLIRSSDKTIYKSEMNYEVLTAVKYNKDFGFQILEIKMSSHSVRQSQGHNKGVVEFLMVQEGAVNLTLEGKQYDLSQGDIIRFEADQPHLLKNEGDQPMRAMNIIYYNKI